MPDPSVTVERNELVGLAGSVAVLVAVAVAVDEPLIDGVMTLLNGELPDFTQWPGLMHISAAEQHIFPQASSP